MPSESSKPPSSSFEGDFAPGQVLIGRYRIIALVGEGGMGQVYLADDLVLGQPVAVKFLPEHIAQRGDGLERFRAEVRHGREVSHPNVARVHDIGEVEGRHFLTMEFVDGEDLASLIKRIGRLPREKASQIAQQICSALSEAHRKGVLHRDLKPANVMLDGDGQVKLTDFGLAVAAEADADSVTTAGTPQYMAPEQLAGVPATVQSEIYALGLLLHELHTGKRALRGRTIEELRREHEEGGPDPPSTQLADIDPNVEAVLVRCLARDPGERPRSVLEVARALPGGDPLAAAMAAGETPSPELVAAAGESEAMAPLPALVLAIGSIVLLVAVGTWAGRYHLRAHVPLDKHPEALTERAREIVEQLGYVEEFHANPTDWAAGYEVSKGAASWIDEHPSPDGWSLLGNARWPSVSFWYRQTPAYYFPKPSWGSISVPPVGARNPQSLDRDELRMWLDLEGRLLQFDYRPRALSEEPPPAEGADWSLLFDLAGLDADDFTPAEVAYNAPWTTDRRAAWVGRHPELPDTEVRIEAGMFGGRPTLFRILWPWEIRALQAAPVAPRDYGLLPTVAMFLVVLVPVFAYALARRHLRRGSADRRGALRGTVAVFAASATWEALRTHASLYTNPVLALFVLGSALMSAAMFAATYLALEPYARRTWPTVMSSWSRLMSGETLRWKDPTAGRSILVGMFAGAALGLFTPLHHELVGFLSNAPPAPVGGDWTVIMSYRATLGATAKALSSGISGACFMTFVLVVARLVVRRQVPAVLLTALVGVAMVGGAGPGYQPGVTAMILWTLMVVIKLGILLRYGLLALAALSIVASCWRRVLATTDWSAWHAQPAITAMVFFAAVAAYAYWAATTGRSLIPAEGRRP